MDINYIIKLKRYIRKGNKETEKRGIYYWLSCLINIYMGQNKL